MLPWSLAHAALNTVFFLWTFNGSVFLLFLNEVGLPKSQVGAVLSLFPFCGLLALGFAPLATRLGRKRVFLALYGVRKLVMAGLLLLPWVLARGGRNAGLVWLLAVIGVFAVLRSLAETAYYPWSQEFVPNRVRGRYTGVSMLLVTATSCVALPVAGHVIGHSTGLEGYLALIAVGTIFGLLGVAAMVPVLGGEPVAARAGSESHRRDLVEALRDRNFTSYLGGLGCSTLGAMLLLSFLPLYVKEQLGVAAGTVVTLDAAAMVGAGVSSLWWGWHADRAGSRPVLLPALALSLLVSAGWLLLPRQAPHVVVWCVALYAVSGVSAGGIAVAASRLLFNAVIPPERNTAYAAVYYAALGLTGGLAPLAAGALLSALPGWRSPLGPFTLDAYSVLFALALALLTAAWTQYRQVRPDAAL